MSIAVARKLLHAIYGMFQSRLRYKGTKLFRPIICPDMISSSSKARLWLLIHVRPICNHKPEWMSALACSRQSRRRSILNRFHQVAAKVPRNRSSKYQMMIAEVLRALDECDASLQQARATLAFRSGSDHIW